MTTTFDPVSGCDLPVELVDVRAHGACRTMEPAAFYAQKIAPETRAVCASCPVQAECLAWAIENEPHGYWGGASERARRRMRAPSPAGGRQRTRGTRLHLLRLLADDGPQVARPGERYGVVPRLAPMLGVSNHDLSMLLQTLDRSGLVERYVAGNGTQRLSITDDGLHALGHRLAS